MKYYIKILYIFMYCTASVWAICAQPLQYASGLRTLEDAKIIDSASIRITYSLEFVADSSKPNEKWNDRKILLIGDSIQHFYSYYTRLSDLFTTEEAREGGAGASKGLKLPAGVCAEKYDIYNNYPTRKQTVIENITHFQMIVYKDDLADIPWNLTSDTMTILKYLCYKAVCRYHGRVWEAWFTLDIPLNAGPWKLRGLPGLILKAYDERKHYLFECSGIEKLKKPDPILMYKIAYGPASDMEYKGTRLGYLKALRRFYEHYVDFFYQWDVIFIL